jgi:helix-turn-helix protein
VTPLERLREAAALLPAGTSLTVTREALLEALGGVDRPVGPDLTVAELSERFHRAPSTIRAWCEAGRFPDAYRLNGRDWRVPPAALEAFRAGQHTGLKAWRNRLGAA